MAVNKLALIRYKTIDQCLRNRLRKWTLEDLIEKVSEVLYETEGISSGVSKRTIQADIQLMRSDKLGYNAPIIVSSKKYYQYSDPSYSITKVPVSDHDIDKMKEVVTLLKQFNGFTYFEEMSEMIARLENNIYKTTINGKDFIQFENNQQVKGLQHLTSLHQAIMKKIPLLLNYQSFKARTPSPLICFPYLLKEYRNRWYLIAKPKKGKMLLPLALDRMIDIQELNKEKFVEYTGIGFDEYYSDLIGVTKTEQDAPARVVMQVSPQHAPYVLTKPIHHSQKLLKESAEGILIQIEVVLNFELERELLGFGEHLHVLSPRKLVSRLKHRLEKTLARY